MPFDDESLHGHEECAKEIRRLQGRVEEVVTYAETLNRVNRLEPVVRLVGFERDALAKRVEELGAERDAAGEAADIAAEKCDALAERVAELEAVVAKLPKTADGVPVTPGMTVWKRCLGQPCSSVVQIRRGKLGGVYSDFDRCYSTREAAEAANRMAHEVARYIEDKEMPT